MTNEAENKTDVDYYFSAISSFAYLGHWAFQELVSRHKLNVTYKPVQLGKIFAASGGLAFAERDPARLRHRLLELKRWSAFRGLDMNIEPKYFPTNPAIADCAIIAVQSEGRNPAELMGSIMRQVWIYDANIAETEVIGRCLIACGEDADHILALAQSDKIQALYNTNSEEGIKVEIIGSPCVVYQGEPFWGQDRFDLLEEAIRIGREPYRPPF